MQPLKLLLKMEHTVRFDNGLAAGRAIYYGDPRYPSDIIKEHLDGRKQLVTIDENSVVTVIKDVVLP